MFTQQLFSFLLNDDQKVKSPAQLVNLFLEKDKVVGVTLPFISKRHYGISLNR